MLIEWADWLLEFSAITILGAVVRSYGFPRK
jgi:hypothetical protein